VARFAQRDVTECYTKSKKGVVAPARSGSRRMDKPKKKQTDPIRAFVFNKILERS